MTNKVEARHEYLMILLNLALYKEAKEGKIPFPVVYWPLLSLDFVSFGNVIGRKG